MQKLVLTWLVAGWLPAVAQAYGSYDFNPDQGEGMSIKEVMDAVSQESGVAVKIGDVLNAEAEAPVAFQVAIIGSGVGGDDGKVTIKDGKATITKKGYIMGHSVDMEREVKDVRDGEGRKVTIKDGKAIVIKKGYIMGHSGDVEQEVDIQQNTDGSLIVEPK